MMWYADKAAFRAGYVDGTEWDKDSIGVYSIASGYKTKAMGFSAVSLGNKSVASGENAVALGADNIANGNQSIAMGNLTTASGNYSTTMGYISKATGNGSTAIGFITTASGNNSTATGQETIASGFTSTAMGFHTVASGFHSSTMGDGTNARGDNSTSIGYTTLARANSAFTMGMLNDTSDISTSPSTVSSIDRIFQIGNGTSSVNRKNAMTVLRNGNVGIGTISPTTKLCVNGDIAYNNYLGACSDIRYKKDFTPIGHALKSILSIKGFYYFWKQNEFPDLKFSDKRQLGFSAQEIEKLFPEIVMTDANGYKSVDYGRITPVLVEAIKEQQKQINSQQQEIDELKKLVEKLMSK